MFRKSLFTAAFACLLAAGSAPAAEVYVRVAPPRPVYERRIAPPGAGYVWTPGYHRWNGRAYEWYGGRWVLPPRPRAVWVPAHWVRRRHGWYLVEGHWR